MNVQLYRRQKKTSEHLIQLLLFNPMNSLLYHILGGGWRFINIWFPQQYILVKYLHSNHGAWLDLLFNLSLKY